MSTDHSDLEDDPRVIQAARDYLADLEAGRKPDRQAYYGRCPELAEAMSECFDGMELAHAAGVALRPAAPPFQPGAARTARRLQNRSRDRPRRHGNRL